MTHSIKITISRNEVIDMIVSKFLNDNKHESWGHFDIEVEIIE